MADITKKESQFSAASQVSESDKGGDDFDKGFAGGGSAVSDPDLSKIKQGLPASVGVEDTVIVGIDDGDVAKYLAENNLSDAVLRVAFSRVDPYLPYVNARMLIQGSSDSTNDLSTFSGVFETDEGGSTNLINQHLVGQPLKSLVKSLQQYSGIQAQILNNAQFLDVRYIKETPVLDATERWTYFFVEDNYGSFPQHNTGLKDAIRYYYTTVEPDLAQNNPNQSLGGYVSPTQVYKESTLAGSISFYDLTLEAIDEVLTGFELLQVGDEIIRISEWNSNVATISERNAHGTPLRFHPAGIKIIGLESNDVFDFVLNKQNAQYRCLAIKNDHSTEIARNVKVFFKLASRNNLSNTRFAIEIPRSEELSSTANNGSATYFVDISLAGVYVDDHFKTAALNMTSGSNSGQTRVVSSYEGSTGTFFFGEAFPNSIVAGNVYTVGTAPSQLISSGKVSPITGATQVDVAPFAISEFQSATFTQNGIDIDVEETRTNGNDLRPGETIYVWIERQIDDSNEFFLNNRMIISVSYTKV